MQRFAEKIRASTFLRHVGWLVRGNILAHLVQLAALPLITRLYSPVEFGILSVFMAFSGFAVIALTWRLESALLIAEKPHVGPLLQLALALVVVMSFLLAALLEILRFFDVLGHNALPAYASALMFLVLIGIGSFNIGRAICLRDGDSPAIARARIERSAGNVAAKLSLGFANFGAAGLLFGELLGAWFAAGRVRVFHVIKNEWMQVSARRMRIALRRYRRFPQLELPSGLVNQLAIALPVSMIAALEGPAAAGFFGIARMIVAVPNSQIGNAVADAFQMRVGELVRAGQFEAVLPLLSRTFKGLLLAGFLPYLAIALVSPWAFPFVLGAEWAMAGKYAALFSAWLYMALAVGSLSRLLSVVQRQELKLFYDVFSLAAIVSVYAYCEHFSVSGLGFVAGIVVANVVAYAIYAIILFSTAAGLKNRASGPPVTRVRFNDHS